MAGYNVPAASVPGGGCSGGGAAGHVWQRLIDRARRLGFNEAATSGQDDLPTPKAQWGDAEAKEVIEQIRQVLEYDDEKAQAGHYVRSTGSRTLNNI